MRLIVKASKWRSGDFKRNRWTRRRVGTDDVWFQISPVRLIGPERWTAQGAVIAAEARLPLAAEVFASQFTRLPNGFYGFDVFVNQNTETLRPFLSSGLKEIEVRSG